MDRKTTNSLLALTLAIAVLGIAGPAQAATITVNTGSDTTPSGSECLGVAGDCSLRRALDKAVSGVDNIVIPASVPTITLVAGNGSLHVQKDLTISGQGPGSNTITGQDNLGLIAITGLRTVTISGVTLTHGKATTGAAIDTDAGHLTLNNVAVTNNTSGGSDLEGFGVVHVGGASPGSLNITGSSFSSNHVGGGGTSGTGFGVVSALSSTVDMTITNTDFTNNTIGGDGGDGFGVLNVTPSGGVPTVDLESVVFRGNTVGDGGIGFGTIDFGGTGDGQTLTVRGAIFDSNAVGGGAVGSTANSGSGNGGGLFISPNGTTTVNVERSTFTNNDAGGPGADGGDSGSGFGGAIYATFSAVGSLSVSNSTFSGNSAGGNGGDGGTSGRGFGGGIYLSLAGTEGTLSVTGSEFSHNTVGGMGGGGDHSGSGFGGGMYASYPSTATITVDRNSFSDARVGGDGATGPDGGTGSAGGFYLNGSGITAAVSVTNNTIARNSIGGAAGAGIGSGVGLGGGLFLSGGTFNLLNNTIDANTTGTATSVGGGIYGANGGSSAISLKNTIVSGNAAGEGSNCADPFTSGGHNIEDTAPSQCGLGAAGDRVGVNPLLGPLANNGGLTLTQGLLAGSPAIDAGDNSGCPATDQRGVARPQAGACDIGAYELAPPATGGGQTNPPITPKLTKLALRPSKILPDKGRGPSISARKRGATVSYTNNTAATTTFTVQRPHKGFRSGKRCRAKRPKRGKAKRCTLYKKVGSFTHKDKAGKNSFHFTGRVKRHRLRPGRYRFEVVARQSGLKSGKVHKSFRIIRQ
jgi:hypothetical protein